jgi:hypothetical protein
VLQSIRNRLYSILRVHYCQEACLQHSFQAGKTKMKFTLPPLDSRPRLLQVNYSRYSSNTCSEHTRVLRTTAELHNILLLLDAGVNFVGINPRQHPGQLQWAKPRHSNPLLLIAPDTHWTVWFPHALPLQIANAHDRSSATWASHQSDLRTLDSSTWDRNLARETVRCRQGADE